MTELLQQPEFLLAAFGGLVIGGTLGAWLVSRQSAKLAAQQQAAEQLQKATLQSALDEAGVKVESLQSQVQELQRAQLEDKQALGLYQQQSRQLSQVEQEKQRLQEEATELRDALGERQSRLESQEAKHAQIEVAHQEKVAMLTAAEQRLQEQFENLANKIFEQKSEKFTQSSKASLDALLTPLKEKIDGFKQQVTDQYVKEGQERASLKTEILGLKELNQQITHEAAALTKALKGDNKQQGNWGEVVLQRILKESGLREGHEFETQVSLKNETGKQYQPDVVVHLPNDKDIVIDSKVSLASYERYYNEQEDEAEKLRHLKEHVASIKTHIKELGKKDYQDLQGLRTLDYVLMFVPVEPAFLLAVEDDPSLVKLALDNNIMLVSPTNLLIALRTIDNIWQVEYQNQNAQKIAENAGKLYDKFHGFVADMEKIGKSIDTVQKSYDAAWNKLSNGRGNLIRQTEQFRKLGVQSNKKLDERLLDNSEEAKTDET